MPNITLNFPFDINISAQIGDTAYYVPTTTSASFNVNSSSVVEIGIIQTITPGVPSNMVVFTNLIPALYPNSGDFILFSKDNKANLSSMLGYYTKIRMRNNDRKKSELFKVSADYSESSKYTLKTVII